MKFGKMAETDQVYVFHLVIQKGYISAQLPFVNYTILHIKVTLNKKVKTQMPFKTSQLVFVFFHNIV